MAPERAASPTEATAAAAFLALPMPALVVGPRQRILAANRAARRFINPRPQDALVVGAVHRVAHKAAGASRVVEELALHGPPALRWRIDATPLTDAVLCVVTDVTHEARLDAVRRDFVANVGHELRTPIGAIALLVDAVRAIDGPNAADPPDLPDPSTEGSTRAHFLSRMDVEVQRLTRLVDDILELSALESEATHLALAPLRVDAVIDSAVGRTSAVARLAGVEVMVRHDGASPEVLGNTHALESAVVNLILNALHHARPTRVEVVRETTPHSAVISVCDNGIGIPSAHIERIFERFYRVDLDRSRAPSDERLRHQVSGTGLGLAIVKHSAEVHGGSVAVVSTEGEGSVFSVQIPLLNAGADRP